MKTDNNNFTLREATPDNLDLLRHCDAQQHNIDAEQTLTITGNGRLQLIAKLKYKPIGLGVATFDWREKDRHI